MSHLYKKTVRAAFANPELRPHLLPLLKEARGFVINPETGSSTNLKDLEAILEASQRQIQPFLAVVTDFDTKGIRKDRLSPGWGKYAVSGQIVASNKGGLWVVPGIDPWYDPRAFKRYVMGALHKYSLMLPGEISVTARMVKGTTLLFVLTGVV